MVPPSPLEAQLAQLVQIVTVNAQLQQQQLTGETPKTAPSAKEKKGVPPVLNECLNYFMGFLDDTEEEFMPPFIPSLFHCSTTAEKNQLLAREIAALKKEHQQWFQQVHWNSDFIKVLTDPTKYAQAVHPPSEYHKSGLSIGLVFQRSAAAARE